MITSFFGSEVSPPFIFGLVVALFYTPALFWARKVRRRYRARAKFFTSVLTIIADEKDDAVALERIKTSFRSFCEIYPEGASVTRSYGQLLEGMYFRMTAFPAKQFKEAYTVEPNAELRQRFAGLISMFREKEPFASVSSKFGNLLFLTQRSIESSNQELGTSSLGQLAQEVEILEDRIRAQEKQNSLAMIVSVVGVVLTIVFGIVSLVPLISSQWEKGKANEEIIEEAGD